VGEITTVFTDHPQRVDLNGDVGEGIGQDPELIPLLTSVNVACGGHIGDGASMRAAVVLARAHGVSVGAHPSFPDREGFGRRAMSMTPDQAQQSTADQIRALATIAAEEGVALRHVKPHGALYNMAARDARLADALARAVAAVDRRLILVGLAGSELINAGQRAGLRTASEVFADRAYASDGSLVPRDQPGAVVHEAHVVVERALAMLRDRAVVALDGSHVPLAADTICIHGDTPGAAALGRRLREALRQAGVAVRPLAF
jgi:5-oxoprolinase (ATP-hydrolysing) subunit A